MTGILSAALTVTCILAIVTSITWYSKTPIYRGFWGQGNNRGKSGSAVNRGFVWFTLCMFSPIWGKGNGRGISGFAVNRGAVNRGFTVLPITSIVTISQNL